MLGVSGSYVGGSGPGQGGKGTRVATIQKPLTKMDTLVHLALDTTRGGSTSWNIREPRNYFPKSVFHGANPARFRHRPGVYTPFPGQSKSDAQRILLTACHPGYQIKLKQSRAKG